MNANERESILNYRGLSDREAALKVSDRPGGEISPEAPLDDLDLRLREAVEPVHHQIDQPVDLPDP